MTNVTVRTQTLTRQQLQQFLGNNPLLIQQFEAVQSDITETIPQSIDENVAAIEHAQATADEALSNAQSLESVAYLVLAPAAIVGQARTLVVGLGLQATDAGAGGNLALRVIDEIAGDQAANAIYAGPAAGAPATPAFRSLVVADLPDVSQFSAHANVAQSIPTGTSFTMVSLDTIDFDHGSHFAASQWTAPDARPVMLTGNVGIGLSAAGNASIAIFKNGSILKQGPQVPLAAGQNALLNMTCIDRPAAGDVYDLRVRQTSGSSQNTIAGISVTWFQGAQL